MQSASPSACADSSVALKVVPLTKKPSGRRRHKHKPGDEALCKYASKACYKPRVAKKTGELHRYCDHHRQQANRNQRRLELRRRLKDGTTFTSLMRHSPTRSSEYSAHCHSSDDSVSDDPEQAEAASQIVNAQNNVVFEPYRQPVALRAEDLSSLQLILAEPSTIEPTRGDVVRTYQL